MRTDERAGFRPAQGQLREEEDDDIIDNPSLNAPENTEDFQEPDIELPLPVAVALQRREARKEFAGAALLADSAKGAGARSSKPLDKQKLEDISLAHHSPRCSICQHPDREAIEQGFLHWESPTLLAYEYDLGHRRAVYRHARAFSLFEKRAARTRRTLEFIMEQAETVTPTADSIIRAVRAYSCVSDDGRWTEPTKRVIITHEHIDRRTGSTSGAPIGHVCPPQRASSVQTGHASNPASSTLGDGYAVPSISAVTPAPSTKPRKMMDTLFARLHLQFFALFLAVLLLCMPAVAGFLASSSRASSSELTSGNRTCAHRIDRSHKLTFSAQVDKFNAARRLGFSCFGEIPLKIHGLTARSVGTNIGPPIAPNAVVVQVENMKAKNRKQSKSRKSLKAAKKLEAQKPLLTYKLTDVFIKSTSWGGAAGGN